MGLRFSGLGYIGFEVRAFGLRVCRSNGLEPRVKVGIFGLRLLA